MEVTATKANCTLNVEVSGSIDTNTASTFEDEVCNRIDGNIKDLVFDFEKVTYMSSAGLRVLLRCLKMMNLNKGKITLLKPNPVVSEVLELTGLSSVLTIIDK